MPQHVSERECIGVATVYACFVFQYGEIEEMNICDNLGDHLVGNVYVKVCSTQRVCVSVWCECV